MQSRNDSGGRSTRHVWFEDDEVDKYPPKHHGNTATSRCKNAEYALDWIWKLTVVAAMIIIIVLCVRGLSLLESINADYPETMAKATKVMTAAEYAVGNITAKVERLLVDSQNIMTNVTTKSPEWLQQIDTGVHSVPGFIEAGAVILDGISKQNMTAMGRNVFDVIARFATVARQDVLKVITTIPFLSN